MPDEDEKIVAFEAGWMQLGFTQVPNVILLNSSLSVGARLLWGTLAHYARQSDRAWPGQERIAVSMGVSERSIRTYLRELEDSLLVKTLPRRTAAGARVSNLYRLLNPSAEMVAEVQRQILPPGPADFAGSQRQDFPPKKKTHSEEEAVEEEVAAPAAGDQLFAVPGEPAAAAPPDPSSPTQPLTGPDPVEIVWAEYERVFAGHYRLGLTPARRSMIAKGLKAIEEDVEVCKAAVRGMWNYRRQNPGGNMSIDAIFRTYPGGANLTDQILRWADNDDSRNHGGSDMLAEYPATIRDKVRRYRIQVVQMYQEPHLSGVKERGENALAWLAATAKEQPVIENDQVTGWVRISE